MIARYHRHRIASAIYEVTLSAQVTITHQRNPFFVPMAGPKLRSRSPVASVLQLIGTFLAMYCPYYITVLWNSSVAAMYSGNVPKSLEVNRYVVLAAATLLACSAFVNGLLYGVKSKIMRKTFQNYWRKKKTKSEICQEIQARTPSTCGSRRPSLTTLGVFNRPIPQRRLSETLGDTNRPLMKRIASEISWRPNSLVFGDLAESPVVAIPHTSSCNTLQIPSRDDNELGTEAEQDHYTEVRNSFRLSRHSNPRLAANGSGNVQAAGGPNITIPSYHSKSSLSTATTALLHKVLRIEIKGDIKSVDEDEFIYHDSLIMRSPRILITRAYSEESQSVTPPMLPVLATDSNLTHQRSHDDDETQTFTFPTASNGTTAKISDTDDDEYEDDEANEGGETSYMQAICFGSSNSASNSTVLFNMPTRRFSSLEEQPNYLIPDTDPTEDQMLLSWPITRKKYTRVQMHPTRAYHNHYTHSKPTLTITQTQITKKLNPLYTDRSEQPDVAL